MTLHNGDVDRTCSLLQFFNTPRDCKRRSPWSLTMRCSMTLTDNDGVQDPEERLEDFDFTTVNCHS